MAGMASHRSFHIEAGKLVSKEWSAPGAPMIQLEGSVTDSRVSELLEELIAKQCWTFEGNPIRPGCPAVPLPFLLPGSEARGLSV